jgi:type IV pilus assembly protein PilM
MDKFERLGGMEITGAPAFKENQLAFGVVYGLCLQLLGRGPMTTNLLPREIVVERMIQSKKPWTVAALSALLLGFMGNYFFLQRSFANLSESRWKDAEAAASSTKSESDSLKSEDGKQTTTVGLLTKIGQEVSANTDRRVLWLELMQTLQSSLSRDPNIPADQVLDPVKYPYTDRKDFQITKIESKFYDDISTWLTEPLKAEYERLKESRENLLGLTPKPAADGSTAEATSTAATDTASSDANASTESTDAGTGEAVPSYVVQLEGHHYYNGRIGKEKLEHTLMHLVDFLERGKVTLPDGQGGNAEFTMKELGIAFPVIVDERYLEKNVVPNPAYYQAIGQPLSSGAGMGGMGSMGGYGTSDGGDMGAMGSGLGDMYGGGGNMGYGGTTTTRVPRDAEGNEIPKDFKAPKYNFTLQFQWTPVPLSERLEKQRAAKKAAEEAEKANETPNETAESVASNP